MEIEHGTLSGYAHYRCRCPECREASRVYHLRLRRDRAYKRRPERMDAAPVREYLRALNAQGMSSRWIARSAGVGIGSVNYVLYGRGGRPALSLPRETAEMLLAVRAEERGHYRVESVGTARRIQALMVLGYPVTLQADMAGLAKGILHRALAGEPVARSSRDRIRDLYERLCMTRWEPEDPWGRGKSTLARKTAQARTWAPPLAWDDIDDPNEVPQGVAA